MRSIPPQRITRTVVVHGYQASPSSHWFGWLAGELGAAGVEVDVITLPDPYHPDPRQWQQVVTAALVGAGESAGTGVDAGLYLVGHSLGCLTVLRALAGLTQPWTVGGVALVSGFTQRIPVIPELDGFITDGSTSDGAGIDIAAATSGLQSALVLRSDDDVVVPPTLTDHLAGQLGVTATVLPGQGHFLDSEGCTELPVLRDAILAGGRV